MNNLKALNPDWSAKLAKGPGTKKKRAYEMLHMLKAEQNLFRAFNDVLSGNLQHANDLLTLPTCVVNRSSQPNLQTKRTGQGSRFQSGGGHSE